MLDKVLRRNRPSKLKVAVWSDDYRGPVSGPEMITSTIDNLNFFKSMMISGITAVLLVNMLLVFAVMSRMDIQAYIADGSRFGCRVDPIQLQ